MPKPRTTFTFTSASGKEREIDEEKVNSHGMSAYAEANPGATIRMRDNNNDDYDIPLEFYDDALQDGLHPFRIEYTASKSEEKPAQAPSAPSPESTMQPEPVQPQSSFRKDWRTDIAANMAVANANSFNSYMKERQSNLGKAIKERTEQPIDTSVNLGFAEKTAGSSGGQDPLSVDGQLSNAYKDRERINQALKKREEELKRADAENTGFFARLVREAAQGTRAGMDPNLLSGDDDRLNTDDQYLSLMAAARKNQEQIYALENEKSGKNNNFWRSFGQEFGKGYLLSPINSYRDSYALINAAGQLPRIQKKIESGEALTEEEKSAAELVNQYSNNEVAQNLYASKEGAWSRAGKTAAGAVDFMVSLALTPGWMSVANVTKDVITKVGSKYLAKSASDALAKNVAKTVGRGLVKMTGITAGSLAAGAYSTNMPTGASKVAKSTAENYYSNGLEDLGSAFAEAERSWIGENATEALGSFLPGGGVMMKGFDKLGLSKISNFMRGLSSKKFVQKYNRVLEATGLNSVPGEAMEEYANFLYDALTGHSEDAIKAVKDPKTHIDIWLGCLTTGVLLRSVPMVAEGYHTGQHLYYKHQLESANKNAVNIFDSSDLDWEEIRDKFDDTENGDMSSVVSGIIRGEGMSREAMNAVIDYAGSLMKFRAHNILEIENANDAANLTPESVAVNNGIASGHELEGEERAVVQDDYLLAKQEAEERFGSEAISMLDQNPIGTADSMRQSEGWSEDDERCLMNYLEKKSMVTGMDIRIEEEVSSRVSEAESVITKQTNVEDGMVHPAKNANDGSKLYIVSGKVATNEDGTVNREASDDTIVVVDENGKKSMVPASSLSEIEQPIPADQLKEESAANIRKEYEQNERDQINGVVTPQPGMVISLQGDDGTYNVTVVGEDGQGNVVVDMGGQQFPIPYDAFQEAAKTAKLSERKAYLQPQSNVPAEQAETEVSPEAQEEVQATEAEAIPADETVEQPTEVEQPQTAIDMIPKGELRDSRGKTKIVRNFEAVDPETTYNALLEVYGDDGRVQKKVSNRINKIDSEIKAVQKQLQKLDESDDFDADIDNAEGYRSLQSKLEGLKSKLSYWQNVQLVPSSIKAKESQALRDQEIQAKKEKEAEAETNQNPTEAQIEAGNYKKGHVTIGDFDITIENPAGSTRSGKDANGKEWSVTMANTYGYIRGTEGVDGDHIDVFLSNDMDGWNGGKVFVVDQTNTDGSFDEHKCMLGFNSLEEAEAAYYANYSTDWKKTHPGIRITGVSVEDFAKWVQSSHRKTKPFAEYSAIKQAERKEGASIEESDNSQKKRISIKKKYNNENAGLERSQFTDQLEEAEAIDKMAKLLGVKAKFTDETGPGDAYISGDTVYIKKGNYSGEKTLKFLVGHEFTHRMQDLSPEQYAKFKQFVKEFMGDEWQREHDKTKELYDRHNAKAKRNGGKVINISDEQIDDEVTADFAGHLVNDMDVFDDFVKKLDTEKEGKSLMQIIRDLFEKVKSYFKPNDQKRIDNAIAQLESLIRQSATNIAEKSEQESLDVAYIDPSTEEARFSLSTYEEQGRKFLKKYIARRIKNRNLTRKEGNQILEKMDELYNICNKYRYQYVPFSNWSDAKVVKDKNGKAVFSVIKPNGEYVMNLDFSLVCKKRRTLDAVFNKMIQRNIIDDIILGQVEVAKINDIIRSYGFETACRLCFVDARRFRVAAVADDFCEVYNNLVKKLIPKGKDINLNYFDFAGEGSTHFKNGLETIPSNELNLNALKRIKSKESSKKSVVSKCIDHLLSHPEDRRLLRRSDFISTQGFNSVKENNNQILSLYNAKKGSGGPKASFGDVQYLNDIAKTRWGLKKAYSVGGVRIQSFSDYVPRMVFDYIQMVSELAAKKLPAHAYTKEKLFVMQFGKTGIKINMSLVPGVAKGGIAPGLDEKGNYVWQEGETFDYEDAIAIQNTEGYRENCGTIAVGVSDEHIRKMMDDPNIRMIIPYHKSGLNKEDAIHNNINNFTDYTDSQNTRYADGTALRKKDFDAEHPKIDVPDYNALVVKSKDPRKAAQMYIDWCKEYNLIPKFSQFAFNEDGTMRENYYKLLEDFTTLVPDENGNMVYHPQTGVRMEFPTENDAFGSMSDLIKEGLEEDAILEGNRDAKISEIVDDIENEIYNNEGERYSLSESEDEESNLVGVHNISEGKLRSALKMGGLANPSLAVIDSENQSHEGYGEISLIAPSSLIDKRTGKNAGTYTGDAWTPTYPQVISKFTGEGESISKEDIKKLPEPMQEYTGQAMDRFINNGEGNGLAYMYLSEKGKAPDVVMQKVESSESLMDEIESLGKSDPSNMSDEELNSLFNLYIDEQYNGDREKYERFTAIRKASLEKKLEESSPKSLFYKSAKKELEDIEKYGFSRSKLSSFASKVRADISRRGQADAQSTSLESQKYISENGLESDFEKWQEDLKDRYNVKEYLQNGYTKDGTSKYIPHTLENVSKYMNKEGKVNTKNDTNYSATRSLMLQRLNTLDQIRKNKGKLGTPSDEDIEQIKSEYSNLITELSEEKKLSDNVFMNMDEAALRLQESVQHKDPIAFLNEEYGYEISKGSELEKNINKVLGDLKNLPSKYFETKFNRPVSFNEFSAAVVPDNIDPNLIGALKSNGIEVYSYKAGDNESRKDAFNQATQSSDDILFRKNKKSKKRRKNKRETSKGQDELSDELQKNKEIEQAAQTLAESLGIEVNVIHDINEVTHSNPRNQEELRKAKGWYSTKTGEVNVVIPNAESVEDVQETILHEVVGHKGMREVVGEDNFNDFLDNVFFNADPKTRSEIIDRIMRNGWDARLATEEYIAELSESGFKEREKHNFFQKIGDAFMDLLSKAKIYLNYRINDNDLRYLLWRSYKLRKSKGKEDVFSKAEDIAMQNELGVGNFRPKAETTEGEEGYDPIRYRVIQDADKIKELESEPKVKAYRTMQVIDGELYSPMAKKVAGKENKPIKFRWEAADEYPELAIKGDGSDRYPNVNSYYITIDKGQGKGSLDVAYNPYNHTSRTVLNDQFSSAYIRPNLVVVEVEIPQSELEGKYKAEKAKDPVGEMKWHSGSVSAKFAELGNPRKVILTRYDKPVRILTKKEEAEKIAESLKGTGISMPYNLVTPQVREELQRLGIQIDNSKSGSVAKNPSYGKAEYITDEQINEMNNRMQANSVNDPESIRSEAEEISEEFNTPVRFISDKETSEENPKGWYDSEKGEMIVNLPNIIDVEDVRSTILQALSVKELKELVGESGYDNFLGELLSHSKSAISNKVNAISEGKGIDTNNAMEEYIREVSEKGYNDLSDSNSPVWTKLKESTIKKLDKFLETGILPKSIKLGENEIRYILWKGHHNSNEDISGLRFRNVSVNPEVRRSEVEESREEMIKSHYGSISETDRDFIDGKIKEQIAAYKRYDFTTARLCSTEIAEKCKSLSDVFAIMDYSSYKFDVWDPGTYKAYLRIHPEQDYATRISNEEEDSLSDLQEMVDRLDLYECQIISRFIRLCYNPSEKKTLRKGLNQITKKVDEQKENLSRSNGLGENLNLKKSDITYDEYTSLFTQLNSDQYLNELFEKVMDVAKNLGLKFHLRKFGKTTFGDNFGNIVRLNLNLFNSAKYSNDTKAQTMLHELIHSVTSYAFDIDRNSEYGGGIQLSEAMREAVQQIKLAFNQIKYDKNFKGEYGIKNIHEMMAELSNPSFRQKLQETTIWERIVDAFKKLFGIKRNDMLSGLETSLSYMLENFDQTAYTGYINVLQGLKGYATYSKREVNTLAEGGSFFSGGGLLEEGLKQVLDPKFAVEYDKKISGVYRNNFGDHIVTADVRDVDPMELLENVSGKVQYFHASPVCKNFSTAKADSGELPLDISTAISTAEAIRKMTPEIVTIENVPRYRNSESMKIITDQLDRLGYNYDIDVYDSADYGAYTSRKRMILRAVRSGNLPQKPEIQERTGGWIDVVGDLIDDLKETTLPPWMERRLSEIGIERYNIKKPLYIFNGGTSTGKLRIAYSDQILPTITTMGGDRIIMPDGRVLAVSGRVLARISGIDDDYILPTSDNLSHKIIGNGIPVKLTKAVIAPLIQSHIQKSDAEELNTSDIRFRTSKKDDVSEDTDTDLSGITPDMAKEAVDEVAQEPKTVSQHLTDALVQLSNSHKNNLQVKKDALAEITASVYGIRKAKSAQKAYDKSTVKDLATLATTLIRGGFFDKPSAYEISRIIAAIKNGSTLDNIQKQAEKILDIIISNQLSASSELLQKLSKVKSKVNASGVEVQGKIDARSKKILDVFRNSLFNNKNTVTPENIKEMIADAEERMSSEDSVVADNAAIEWEGLNLANRYMETIRESMAEETELRAELAKAAEDKSNGTMTPESYKEFVESTKEAIRSNQLERIDAYSNLIGDLISINQTGRESAKDFIKEEKERVSEIHHNANSDMEGIPNRMYRREEQTWKQKLANNPILRFLFAPLATFDQMLRMFGSKSVNGEGYLFNRYMPQCIYATGNEYDGMQEAFEILDNKVSELFGKKMKWSDLYAYEKKVENPIIHLRIGGKEPVDCELSQGNALYIYMANKMEDGVMKLRKMGITQKDVDNLTSLIDPRFIELADWLQEYFMPMLRNKYNEVYKRMYGIPMADIENYYPLRILSSARQEDVDISENTDGNNMPSTITSSVIKRRRNSTALDILNTDAFSLVVEHIQEMEHWNAFAEFNRDINTLLSYRHFKNQVLNMTSIYGSGRTLWDTFFTVSQIVAGQYRPAGKKGTIDSFVVNIGKNVTAAKITFRIYTAIKQLLSLPSFAVDASAAKLAKNLSSPIEAWNWSMENLPIFRKRWMGRQAGDSRLMSTDLDWNFIPETFTRIGMTPNAFVDAMAVSIGAKSIYDTKYEKYIEYGYSEYEADRKAKMDATIIFNETQQSNESMFLAPIQLDRTTSSVALTVFRNSSFGYQRQLVDAIRTIYRMTTEKDYHSKSIEFMTKQNIRSGLSEQNAVYAAKKEYKRALFHNMAKMAMFGFILQFAWNIGSYLPYILFGDDDDKKKEMMKDAAIHGMFGSTEGLSGGSIISESLNMLAQDKDFKDYDPTLLPAISDTKRLVQTFGTDYVEGVNSIINLLVQGFVGVNPQSITETAISIYDACGGDIQTTKEATIFAMRVLNVPQSQIDQVYVDEINLSAREAQKYTISELASRYAKYRLMRGSTNTMWMYDEEGKDAALERHKKRFERNAKERILSGGDAAVNESFNQYLDEYVENRKHYTNIQNYRYSDTDKYAQKLEEFMNTPEGKRYAIMMRATGILNHLAGIILDTKDPEVINTVEEKIAEAKKEFVSALESTE